MNTYNYYDKSDEITRKRMDDVIDEMFNLLYTKDWTEYMSSKFIFSNIYRIENLKRISNMYTSLFFRKKNYQKIDNIVNIDNYINKLFEPIEKNKIQELLLWLPNNINKEINNINNDNNYKYKTIIKKISNIKEKDKYSKEECEKNIELIEKLIKEVKNPDLKLNLFNFFYEELCYESFLAKDINDYTEKIDLFINNFQNENKGIVVNFLEIFYKPEDPILNKINEEMFFYYRKVKNFDKKDLYSLDVANKLINSILLNKKNASDLAKNIPQKKFLNSVYRKKSLLVDNIDIAYFFDDFFSCDVKSNNFIKFKGKLNNDYDFIMNQVLNFNKIIEPNENSHIIENTNEKFVSNEWIEVELEKEELSVSVFAHVKKDSILDFFDNIDTLFYQEIEDISGFSGFIDLRVKNKDFLHFLLKSNSVNSGSKKIFTLKLILNENQKEDIKEIDIENYKSLLYDGLLEIINKSNEEIIEKNSRKKLMTALIDLTGNCFKEARLRYKIANRKKEEILINKRNKI